MSTQKIVELADRWNEIDLQIAKLNLEKTEIESRVNDLIKGRAVESGLQSKTKKKKRKRGYKRVTPAGQEIDAFESIILEYFKNHPDTEVTTSDLYEYVETQNSLEKSRVRAAITRLRKSRFILTAARGVYVFQKNRGGKNSSAEEDERAILKAMESGEPMRCKDILGKIKPPSYRYHALENRIWMMSKAGKIRRIDRGLYQKPNDSSMDEIMENIAEM